MYRAESPVSGFYGVVIFFVIFALSLTVLAHLVVPKCPAFLENLPAVQPGARILLHPPDVGRK